MGSVDDGTDIRVELDEVALQRIQLGQIPCVDCGYLTKFFCNHCLRRFIPLCPRCELVNLQCHFCRGEDWCDLPGTWNHNSVIKHMLRQTMLPDHGYRPIAIGDLKNEEWLFKDRDKKWDPALQEYVFRVELQPTENARPSSSSTEAASGDLHT